MADIKTFKNMQDKVLAWLDEAGDDDTTLDLVKLGLIESNKKRVSQEKWSFMLWYAPQTLTILAGTSVYSLHPEYLRPLYFKNLTEKDYMSQVDEATLVQTGIDWNNDTAPALRFTLWSKSDVVAQPAAASVLTVASSQVSDNANHGVTIIGDTADGVQSEHILANASGSVQFTQVLKVTKDSGWVGTMTLTAGAVTILKLFAAEMGRLYQQIKFVPPPDANASGEYLFYRQPTTMSADNDRPDIPTPFEDLLVYDTLLGFAAYNQYDPQVVGVWTNTRDEILTALQQAYSDDRALEGAIAYTDFIPR